MIQFIDAQYPQKSRKILKKQSLKTLPSQFERSFSSKEVLKRSNSHNNLTDSVCSDNWCQLKLQQNYFISRQSSKKSTRSDIKQQLLESFYLMNKKIFELKTAGIDTTNRDAVTQFLAEENTSISDNLDDEYVVVGNSIKDKFDRYFEAIELQPVEIGVECTEGYALISTSLSDNTDKNDESVGPERSIFLDGVTFVSQNEPSTASSKAKIEAFFEINKISKPAPTSIDQRFDTSVGCSFVSESTILQIQSSQVPIELKPISTLEKSYISIRGRIKRKFDNALLNKDRKITQGSVHDCYVDLKEYGSKLKLAPKGIKIHKALEQDQNELAQVLLELQIAMKMQPESKVLLVLIGVHALQLVLIESRHAVLGVITQHHIFVVDSKSKLASVFKNNSKITYISTNLQSMFNTVDCTRLVTHTAIQVIERLLEGDIEETVPAPSKMHNLFLDIPQPIFLDETPGEATKDEGDIEEFEELH